MFLFFQRKRRGYALDCFRVGGVWRHMPLIIEGKRRGCTLLRVSK